MNIHSCLCMYVIWYLTRYIRKHHHRGAGTAQTHKGNTHHSCVRRRSITQGCCAVVVELCACVDDNDVRTTTRRITQNNSHCARGEKTSHTHTQQRHRTRTHRTDAWHYMRCGRFVVVCAFRRDDWVMFLREHMCQLRQPHNRCAQICAQSYTKPHTEQHFIMLHDQRWSSLQCIVHMTPAHAREHANDRAHSWVGLNVHVVGRESRCCVSVYTTCCACSVPN